MQAKAMISKENPRPGGRSARVQTSVHEAVRQLLGEMDRAEITIPMVAQRAGVTPSTIYRRWGELQDLLADVAVAHLRPETEPVETGSARADLETWVEQYADEMSSGVGRQMMHDVLATPDEDSAGQCCGFLQQQLAVIVERAKRSGENFPDLQTLLDRVIAPIVYRILFVQPFAADYPRRLIADLFPAANGRR